MPAQVEICGEADGGRRGRKDERWRGMKSTSDVEI